MNRGMSPGIARSSRRRCGRKRRAALAADDRGDRRRVKDRAQPVDVRVRVPPLVRNIALWSEEAAPLDVLNAIDADPKDLSYFTDTSHGPRFPFRLMGLGGSPAYTCRLP